MNNTKKNTENNTEKITEKITKKITENILAKKCVLKTIAAISFGAFILMGCGSDNKDFVERVPRAGQENDKAGNKDNNKDNQLITADDVDVNELKENDNEMFYAANFDWGLVDSTEDYWERTDYIVCYDGTMKIEKNYNLSGKQSAVVQLSDKDYKKIYVFGYNGANTDIYDDIYIDACDGEGWKFSFTDTDDETTEIYSGYTYDVKDFEKIQDILIEYEKDAEFAGGPDSGNQNGVDYSAADAYPPKTWECTYYMHLTELYDAVLAAYTSPDSTEIGDDLPYAYYIYDVTEDGVPELFVKKGDCEANFYDEIYMYDGDEGLERIAMFSSGHSTFYSHPEGGIIKYTAHMGYGDVSHIAIAEGMPVCEPLYSESGYDDDGNWDYDFEYTDITEIVEGAQYIEYYDLDDFTGINTYHLIWQ